MGFSRAGNFAEFFLVGIFLNSDQKIKTYTCTIRWYVHDASKITRLAEAKVSCTGTSCTYTKHDLPPR